VSKLRKFDRKFDKLRRLSAEGERSRVKVVDIFSDVLLFLSHLAAINNVLLTSSLIALYEQQVENGYQESKRIRL